MGKGVVAQGIEKYQGGGFFYTGENNQWKQHHASQKGTLKLFSTEINIKQQKILIFAKTALILQSYCITGFKYGKLKEIHSDKEAMRKDTVNEWISKTNIRRGNPFEGNDSSMLKKMKNEEQKNGNP